ncbi:MAG: TetR/AcrR family transcriptional regulator [Melioribacteraceae bacterium]|nr:TetR/AcrR family transcriptional regulator [Melioribacteraceae bacterium]
MARKYNMTERSKLAAQTTGSIISATERLLTNRSLNDINLKAIAKEAGTTVQTVLRHMNSREGCIEAVAKVVTERVAKQRESSEYDTIEKKISGLIRHYESEGKLVLNLLAQEQKGDSFASDLTRQGRTFHRNWVEQSYKKYLPVKEKDTIDALVAVTDIYTWKLLRLDLGRSRNATKRIITNSVKKLLEAA